MGLILIVFRLWRTRVPEYKWVAGRLFFASGNRRLRECDKETVPLSRVKARKSQGLGRGCRRARSDTIEAMLERGSDD